MSTRTFIITVTGPDDEHPLDSLRNAAGYVRDCITQPGAYLAPHQTDCVIAVSEVTMDLAPIVADR